jgi:hypothetical protein
MSALTWAQRNPERWRAYARRYYLDNQKDARDATYWSSIWKRYRLTKSDYMELFAAQHGGCAICGREQQRLHVDHDHDTGKIRGLLCGSCNRGIGLLRHNPTILNRAAMYLDG